MHTIKISVKVTLNNRAFTSWYDETLFKKKNEYWMCCTTVHGDVNV